MNMSLRQCLSFFWIAIALQSVGAQTAQTSAPIVSTCYQRVTTHEELLRFVTSLKSTQFSLQVSTIGRSAKGRSIPLLFFRSGDSVADMRKPTVLLFCSQHGNEPSGKEAALLLAKDFADGEKTPLLKSINLLLIPSVNPDGNDDSARTNGNRADLNRSHLTLLQPEVQALHDVYAQYRPEVTLDVHEFGTGGRDWERAGYVRAMDEQFGAPTNLNSSTAIKEMITERLFPALEQSLATQRVRFFEYAIMGSPFDTIRHSTTDINDGRQSFAILNSFSMILEGRNGGQFSASLRRRVTSQYAALSSFLEWISAHAVEIRTLVLHERRSLEDDRSDVVLQMDHFARGTLFVPVRSLATGKDSLVDLRFAPDVKPILNVHRPAAYIIPAAQKELMAFLERHHILYRRFIEDTLLVVESYTIDSLASVQVEGASVLTSALTRNISVHRFHAGDVLVSLHQIHSTMLVIALEPQSWWGLIQYEPFAFLRQRKTEYPVYRIPG